jgi:hypothetical protein
MVRAAAAASTVNFFVTDRSSPVAVGLAKHSEAPLTCALYGPGSISDGGGQFQSLCGLGQKVDPQLLSSRFFAAVRMFLPASAKVTMRPLLAESTANTVSPKVKV